MLRRAVELGAELTEVARMNDWLHGLAQDAGLPDALRDDIKLCLNEAVANIIMYGAATDGPLQILLEIEMSSGGARAVLTDTSHPFDPLVHPEPARITSVETAQIGGFGISLIRATARELAYERRDGRNVLTITCGTP